MARQHCIAALFLLLITCARSSRSLQSNLTMPEVPPVAAEVSITAEDDSEQELSSQLEEVDSRSGGWSSWLEWAPCSRSCDGGVSHQLRTCKTGSCRGEHVRYKICNMQPCPEAHDFRNDQCKAYSNNPYQGLLYDWVAHYDDENPCVLTCRGKPITADEISSEEAVLVVVRLADKVHDGTRCRPGSLDMCIDGKCQRVGCDLRIGSTNQVDECGVCGGDGSSCSRPLYHWTVEFASLCSVTCGGGYKMSRPVCQNRVSGEEVEEELCNDSQKPDSNLVQCNVHNCPAKWHAGDWGPCSVTCGGGSKLRQVHCVEEANNTKIRVEDEKCSGHKPWFQEACNQMDCPSWFSSPWSGCSVSCGEGVQVRIVECRDSKDKTSALCSIKSKPTSKKPCSTGITCPYHIDTSEELLPGLYHTQPLVQPYPPPPAAERLVGEQVVPSESTFIPDEWGPCSVSCGEGIRKREVHCKIFLEFSRTIAKLPDKQCTGPKPLELEKCYMEPCTSERIGVDIKDDPYRTDIKVAGGSPGKSYSWKEQGYTHCSATCLGGVQELIVNCVRDDTQKVTSPYMCPIELKPEILMRTCNDHPCPPRWNYSEFSPCSQSCGIGIQTREVNCIHEVTQGGGNTVIVPNNMCPQPPPPDRQYCNVLDCPVRWKVHEWSRCTKSCGGGEKTRKVECKQVMAQNHTVDRPPNMCPSPKPLESKPCNTKSCIVESDKPHIDVSNSTFIQHDPKKKKISLKVGGAATVFLGTTIKIKCPVKRFNRTKIQWAKDKNYLPKSKKYKTSKKGALRVQNLTMRDSGLYTCIAGKSTASIQISVRPKPGEFPTSEEIQKQGYKTDRGDLVSDIHVDRDGKNPIFSDDHSHEMRPDSPRKKPTSKTKLFTPTLPSLRLDPNINNINAWNSHSTSTSSDSDQKDKISHLPSSSSGVNPSIHIGSTSSASRVMPNFQRLIYNLQQLWPFQTFSNSRGHRMVAFPEDNHQPTPELPITENPFTSTLNEGTDDDEDGNKFGTEVDLGKGTKEDLKFEWMITDWSKCSETCGGNGFQMRAVECIVRLHNATQSAFNNLCNDAGLETPKTRRKCGFEECPQWVVVSDYEPCEEAKCFAWHKALQKRKVKCQIGTNSNLFIKDDKCDQSMKPTHRKECYNDKCVGKWKVGPWSECNANCESQGVKYRILQCVWHGTKKPAGTACKDITRPPVMKTCKGSPCSSAGIECKDHSMFCPNVKAMNMCKIHRYQQQCCQTCKE